MVPVIAAGVAAGTYRLPVEKKAIAKAKAAAANRRRGPRKDRDDNRMPQDQMAPLYFDKRLSNAELEEAVTAGGKYSAVSYDTMRRIFGQKRDAIVGRPSAARRAATI